MLIPQEILEKVIDYLPHGVEVRILNHKSDYVGIERAKVNGYYMLKDKPHFTYKGGSTGKSIFEIRFLLRPMTQITQEIEHNGERFTPIDRLRKIKPNLDFDDTGDLLIDYYEVCSIDYPETGYSITKQLKKWHFDVDRLIEAGIAEDLSQI